MTSSLASADVPAWNTPTIILKNDSRSVPDDWDNDDPAEESAKEIWDRANAAAPMPQIQISSQSNVPPVAAITPSMRILQRPKSNPSSQSSANQTPTSTKSLQEREADYKAARDRIFAGSGGSPGSSREASPAPKRGVLTRGRGNGHRKASPPEGSSAGIAREPHGAQEGRGFAPRGRRGRGGRGGSSQ
ncbi:unnamed protein product [Rhizoctonia solani]|uniref:SUZ domain-containing protein n=1 Tax=Rhizoctonia solani TaxID=456999 RepID=A0A8H3I0G1_9AGAM|nr:unnamed protein product [Rhizoctonia solani]